MSKIVIPNQEPNRQSVITNPLVTTERNKERPVAGRQGNEPKQSSVKPLEGTTAETGVADRPQHSLR